MVKKYDSAPPASSSDEETSDSKRDVSDTENDASDTDNDVVDSDSEDVNSENDVVDVAEESEEEQPIGLLKKSTAGASSSKVPTAGRASSSKAQAVGSSSSEAPEAEPDSESASDDELHSVSSPDSDGFSIRQIVVKPEQEEAEETSRRRRVKQPARSKTRGSEVENGRKRKKKRRVDDIEGPDRSERKKKKEANGVLPSGKPEKRRMFQRIWSEEDEIALLKGLGDYERKNGKNPFYDMDGFSEFIKKSIKVRVTARQLVDKARRMRRKFAKNVSRGKDGKDPTFKRPHDRRAFEVSKAIWGDGKLKVRPYSKGRPAGAGKRTAASRKCEVTEKEKAPQKTRKKKKGGGRSGGINGGGGGNGSGGGSNGGGGGNGGEDFWSRYPSVRDSVNIFPYLPEWGRNFMMESLIHNTPKEKLDELEGRWKELREAVSQLHVRHLQLLKETMMLPDEATPDRQ